MYNKGGTSSVYTRKRSDSRPEFYNAAGNY